MKAKTKTIYRFVKANGIITLAGLVIIIIGILANLFSIYNNRGFIDDPISSIYYARYIIILGGGFIIGYLLTKKNTTKNDRLFLGINYAALAVALSWVFDLIRVTFQNIFGYAPYPWSKTIFECLPLLPVIAILVLAYFLQYKPKRTDFSKLAKITLIASFLIWVIYNLFSGAYDLITGAATFAPNQPIWQTIISYATMPIAILIISYVLLNAIKQRFDRLFLAILIATFYNILIFVLWEFRTDASADASTIFGNVVTFICVPYTGIILWKVRKSIK